MPKSDKSNITRGNHYDPYAKITYKQRIYPKRQNYIKSTDASQEDSPDIIINHSIHINYCRQQPLLEIDISSNCSFEPINLQNTNSNSTVPIPVQQDIADLSKDAAINNNNNNDNPNTDANVDTDDELLVKKFIDLDYGICCFCSNECNPCSQTCGHCARSGGIC